MKDWNIQETTGYKPLTTFYTEFGMAEDLGGSGSVKKFYEHAMANYVDDYKFLTEFVMVLNWKIWEHYRTNESLARVYDSLWRKADSFAQKTLKGKELSYFYRTTD